MIKTRSCLKRHCYLTTVRTNDQISIFLTQTSFVRCPPNFIGFILNHYIQQAIFSPLLKYAFCNNIILTGVPKDNLFFFFFCKMTILPSLYLSCSKLVSSRSGICSFTTSIWVALKCTLPNIMVRKSPGAVLSLAL